MDSNNVNLPSEFETAMKELLGDEYTDYLASFNAPRTYGLRSNALKLTPDTMLDISPFSLKRVPWIDNGFFYDEEMRPSRHPFYFAGLYYLQEPSAMTPAYVMPVNPGDKVLDMCAAPGGKSTELAAKLAGTGLLVSNDISASRAKGLLKNLEVSGVPNFVLTCEYPDKLADSFSCFFDKILVDAPCSGEGMFRKDSKLIKSWMSEGPDHYAPIQRTILDAAARCLKDGGYLLYSTCTFSRKEDEDNIKWFLEEHPEFTTERIFDYEGFTRGFDLADAVRIFPHKMQGEGHFICLMHKAGDSSGSYMPPVSRDKLSGELSEFIEACGAYLKPDRLFVNGDKVLMKALDDSTLRGLRVLRNGLLVGELKKNRFEPAQALAMAMKPSDYRSTVNITDEQLAVKYLKGETIDVPDECITGRDKNVLIAYRGYTLGWGRLNGNTVKNRYLAGWRWS